MYGILPSKVLAEATTYDLMVMDIAMAWENHQYEKATNKKSTPQIPQEQLIDMIKKVRSSQ